MKKKFTLIEILIVIVVFLIFSSILIPNIKDVKNQATHTAILENIHSLQTGVDLFMLEHEGEVPASNVSELQPKPIDMDKLYPNEIRNLSQTTGVTYWVDIWGNVWGSKLSLPHIKSVDGGKLSWVQVEGAVKYHIYKLSNFKNNDSAIVSKVSKSKLILVEETRLTNTNLVNANTTYLVSAIDKDGFETAPIGFLKEKEINDPQIMEEPNETVDDNIEEPTSPSFLNHAPFAVISINTDTIFANETTINWDSSESYDPDGDSIIEEEWEWNGQTVNRSSLPKILEEGLYTVKLRVKDNKEVWSQWTSKQFYVTNGKIASDIYMSDRTAFVVLKNGTVKAWGDNTYGQLGLGYVGGTITTPTLVPTLSNVRKIAANFSTTYAILTDGSVMAFGQNDTNGRLGIGKCNVENIPIPTKMSLIGVKDIYDNFAVLSDGTVKGWYVYTTNLGSCGPKTLINLNNISYILKDSYYGNIALSTDSKTGKKYALAWGSTNSGQYPTVITDGNLNGKSIKQIESDNAHSTYVLYEDGTVKAWGENTLGQLGLGTVTSVTIPTVIPSLSDVEILRVDYYHVYAILKDKTVKGWGMNYKELGTGSTSSYLSTPTILPLTNVVNLITTRYSTISLMEDNSYKIWGDNYNGELGFKTATTGESTPVLNPYFASMKKIVCKTSSCLGVMENGDIYGWGLNSFGQLGVGNTINQFLPKKVLLD